MLEGPWGDELGFRVLGFGELKRLGSRTSQAWHMMLYLN